MNAVAGIKKQATRLGDVAACWETSENQFCLYRHIINLSAFKVKVSFRNSSSSRHEMSTQFWGITMKILNKKDGSTLKICLEDMGDEKNKKNTVIALLQETKVTDDRTIVDAVYITSEMVDEVCNELQKLKKENEV